MTPKEKSWELVSKFGQIYVWDNSMPNEFNEEFSGTMPRQIAKECALICCDEVLGDMGADRGYSFWTEVKQELEKL